MTPWVGSRLRRKKAGLGTDWRTFLQVWKRASGTYKKSHFGKPVRAQEGRSRRTGSKEGSGKAPGKEHLCRSLEACVQGPLKKLILGSLLAQI